MNAYYKQKWNASDSKEDRRWSRKHWTTGDPQLFDYVATCNGYTYDPFSIDHEEEVERRERRWDQLDRLARAMQELKPQWRETVQWYYIEGKTYQWIADAHSVSVSTAYKRLNKALEKLRVIIERDAHIPVEEGDND